MKPLALRPGALGFMRGCPSEQDLLVCEPGGGPGQGPVALPQLPPESPEPSPQPGAAVLGVPERRHREGLEASAPEGVPLEAQIEAWIDSRSDSVTLESLAARFGYHPAYVSAFLKQKAGRGFKQILLEKRMEKARILLEGTDLTIEEIASMLGYGNPSSFCKALGARFGASPARVGEKAKGPCRRERQARAWRCQALASDASGKS